MRLTGFGGARQWRMTRYILTSTILDLEDWRQKYGVSRIYLAPGQCTYQSVVASTNTRWGGPIHSVDEMRTLARAGATPAS